MKLSLFAALGLVLTALGPSVAAAHPVGFGVLQLSEVRRDTYAVELRVSGGRARALAIEAVLPAGCRALRPATTEVSTTGVDRTYVFECAPLEGEVGVSGLPADLQIQLRVDRLNGGPVRELLDFQRPRVALDGMTRSPFEAYVGIGVEHILGGPDHLLFVFGLVLLLWGRNRALIMAVTAFTAGHSVTLTLATFGWIQPGTRAAEIVIAMSIVLLAVEVGRDGTLSRSKPWWIAGGFGLVHGLGFAGALVELGVPRPDLPMALLGFNVGVELGQLAFVLVLYVFGLASARVPLVWRTRGVLAATYLIGISGVFWCLDRI